MATFRLRRFSKPETLKSIAPAMLLPFLQHFDSYFRSRGVELPESGDVETFDWERLIDVFMAPDAKTPQELVDALYYVDELSTDEGMNALLDEVDAAHITLTGGLFHAPADVAIEVWLHDPTILERVHASQYLSRPRSYVYYPVTGPVVPDFLLPTDGALRALEADLDNWFEKRRRGRASLVMMFPREECVWFLVRHGDPLRREGSIDHGEPSSVLYRPVKYDVVVYDQEIGDLRVNAGTEGERRMYREQFGKHLFGDPQLFGERGKYSLEPLRSDGRAALNCEDIAGIDSIQLTEVHLRWPGAYQEREIRKSPDLFRAFESRGARLPENAQLVKAGFAVKFSNARNPRKVTIELPGKAQFRRDDDADYVEAWLKARGFVLNGRDNSHEPAEEAESLLVGA
jgi:hypothetical protein